MAARTCGIPICPVTVENSQDVDLIIHEVFNPPETYMDKLGWPEQQAKIVAWTKHTSPEAGAKVFAGANPGLAMHGTLNLRPLRLDAVAHPRAVGRSQPAAAAASASARRFRLSRILRPVFLAVFAAK